MKLTDIYERVLIIYPDADERIFLNHFNDTVSLLDAEYGTVKKLLFSSENSIAYDILDDVHVLELYHPAIVDNIIYMFTGNENNRQLFLKKARDAYNTYWSQNLNGKRIKPLKRKVNSDVYQ